MSGFGIHMPTRGGTRGGQGEFKWDDVKTDKYREHYLGHSLQAPIGRWQKGRDLKWWSKNKDDQDRRREAIRQEQHELKLREQDALAEALGLGPAARRVVQEQLSVQDMKETFAKTAPEDIGREEKADRISGLGFGGMETVVGRKKKEGPINFQGDDPDATEGLNKISPQKYLEQQKRAAAHQATAAAAADDADEYIEVTSTNVDRVLHRKHRKERKHKKKKHKKERRSAHGRDRRRHDSDGDDDAEQRQRRRETSRHRHDRDGDDSQQRRSRRADTPSPPPAQRRRRERVEAGPRPNPRPRARSRSRSQPRSRSRSPPRRRRQRHDSESPPHNRKA